MAKLLAMRDWADFMLLLLAFEDVKRAAIWVVLVFAQATRATTWAMRWLIWVRVGLRRECGEKAFSDVDLHLVMNLSRTFSSGLFHAFVLLLVGIRKLVVLENDLIHLLSCGIQHRCLYFVAVFFAQGCDVDARNSNFLPIIFVVDCLTSFLTIDNLSLNHLMVFRPLIPVTFRSRLLLLIGSFPFFAWAHRLHVWIETAVEDVLILLGHVLCCRFGQLIALDLFHVWLVERHHCDA